ncbi:hypothetical protein [Nonomuraea sp. NPDC049504]|uniref:hypothetical protein n=1 Tax=Nonomuraea sp. NPDC049504 TaxID=3154729 RepID=UPI00341F2D11
MDLTAVLLRAVAARPHVFLATMPGGTPVRLALERELRLRDLPIALTPADTDILLVAGPGHPRFEAVERLWRDTPAPRQRVHVEDPRDAATVIDAACARLSDPDDDGARERTSGKSERSGDGGDDMKMPAGLPMAERGPDRDGLTLDRLHVSLGPFLPDWPHGLTVGVTLQGDVVQEAELAHWPVNRTPAGACFWTEPWVRAAAGERVRTGEAARRRAAAHLDSLGRFLAVAGWPAAAMSARRLRDALLGEASREAVLPLMAGFTRRVGGSRTLYWLTRGLGPLPGREAAAAGIAGPAARADGDVSARYRLWLAAVRQDMDRLEDSAPLDPVRHEPPRGPLSAPRPPSAALAEVLPRLLAGAELAAARLIVASLDPDPDEPAAQPAGTAHD